MRYSLVGGSMELVYPFVGNVHLAMTLRLLSAKTTVFVVGVESSAHAKVAYAILTTPDADKGPLFHPLLVQAQPF